MDLFTLDLKALGARSLAVAFTKYTIEKRKRRQAEDNMKNQLRRF